MPRGACQSDACQLELERGEANDGRPIDFASAALHASFCFMVGDGFVLKQPKKNVPFRHADKLHQARTSASNWDAKLEIAQERALLFLRAEAVGVCRTDFDQQFQAAHAKLLMAVFYGSVQLPWKS